MDVKNNLSLSKKRSFTDASAISSKRMKQKPVIEKPKVQNKSVNENIALTTKNQIWNDNWLAFKETPILKDIEIDHLSMLKWCPNFISKEEGDALFSHLNEVLKFEHTEIKMYGKPVNLPRHQSWFAEDGLVVKELFQKQKQRVWTPPMRKLKAQLETQLGIEFDYCLVNKYRNGNDYINFHADNETKDTVASVSLGATRQFLVRHISCFDRTQTRQRKPLTTPNTKEYGFSLANGSLIVMLGETQQHWKHSIPKEKKVNNARINLTFRKMRAK